MSASTVAHSTLLPYSFLSLLVAVSSLSVERLLLPALFYWYIVVATAFVAVVVAVVVVVVVVEICQSRIRLKVVAKKKEPHYGVHARNTSDKHRPIATHFTAQL